MMWKAFRFALVSLASLACLLATIWAAGALYFDLPIASLRAPLALGYGLAMLAALLFIKGRWRAMGVVTAVFAAVLAWWLTIKATEDRAWQPDVARRAWADVQGDEITLHNVRNCEYRTETDYTPRWETRVVHLSKLTGVDLAITYWGSPWIAHPIASFQFSDSLPIAISIETRKTIGQEYSTVRGFYRQYDLIYIPADERDVIRLRTNYRHGEDVYLYHTTAISGTGPRHFSRISQTPQPPARTSRVLQRHHRQLHDQHPGRQRCGGRGRLRHGTGASCSMAKAMSCFMNAAPSTAASLSPSSRHAA